MPVTPGEQRNRYKGSPARAWVRLRFELPGGAGHIEKDLVCRHGLPCGMEFWIRRQRHRR
jgi:hypothetical protein